MVAASPAGVEFRTATISDAAAVAALHTESWRRHYRGAYSDAFLDGDVTADRLAVWTERLERPSVPPATITILAESHSTLVGFAHTVFDDDPQWGALLDNLHVTYLLHRQGIGARLLALTAEAVLDRRAASGLYLWVLEHNVQAQDFYRARGGTCVGRRDVRPPGGIAGRLNGTPVGLRYAWPDPSLLLVV